MKGSFLSFNGVIGFNGRDVWALELEGVINYTVAALVILLLAPIVVLVFFFLGYAVQEAKVVFQRTVLVDQVDIGVA